MTDKTVVFSIEILEPFLPLVPNLEWCPIGSRTYMPAPKSDFDIMFHSRDREHVVDYLRDRGVDFKVGMEDSVKFNVRVDVGHLALVEAEVNFCFVSDFFVWKSATDVMACISRGFPNNPFIHLSKKQRLSIFADLVEQFGGKRPPMFLRSF